MKGTCLKIEALWIILFIILLLFYYWRVEFGMVSDDEIFYITTENRFICGACPLVDEWHPAQLVGLLMMPFLKLIYILRGSVEGIFMVTRCCYVAMLALSTLVVYFLMRKCYGVIITGFACILMMLFVPSNIFSFGYNGVGILCVWMISVLLVSTPSCSTRRCVVMGILLAAAVLCCPFLVILYAACTVLSILNGKKENSSIFSLKKWCYVNCGIAIVFAYFVAVLILNPSFSFENFIDNISYSSCDEDHRIVGAGGWCYLVPPLIAAHPIKFYIFIGMLCVGVPLIAIAKVKNYGFPFFVLSLASVSGIFLSCSLMGEVYTNIAMFPLTVLGGFAYFLSKDRKEMSPVMVGWWIGIIYGCCLSLGSNQSPRVFSAACSVSSFFSVLLIWSYLRQNVSLAMPVKRVILVIFLISQFVYQEEVLRNIVYGENRGAILSEAIDIGPCAGVISTPYHAALVRQETENISSLNLSERNTFFSFRFPLGYIVAPSARVGTHSTWVNSPSLKDKRLLRYYELHPENIPDVIYCSIDRMPIEDLESFCRNSGYSRRIFSNGSIALRMEDRQRAYSYWLRESK